MYVLHVCMYVEEDPLPLLIKKALYLFITLHTGPLKQKSDLTPNLIYGLNQ